VVLALRRRFEALVLGATLLFIAAVGALLIASPRRAVTAEPLLCALASTAAASLAAALRGTLREHSARP
jgi:hypothetical protein